MDDKITIIEGPPPTFEMVPEGWITGLNDSPLMNAMVMTRLRTFNSQALVERCFNTWKHNHAMHLEYRLPDGLRTESQIVAARAVEAEEGPMLLLWLRMPAENTELEIGYDDDGGEN